MRTYMILSFVKYAEPSAIVPADAAEVDVVLTVSSVDAIFVQPVPPPPDAVPVVTVPSDATKIFPFATSEAAAVTTEQSSKRAVPPPVFGNRTAGTSGIAPV